MNTYKSMFIARAWQKIKELKEKDREREREEDDM